MNIHSGNKLSSSAEQEISGSVLDRENISDEDYQLEIAAMTDAENINLDDALDDDNENPVSHTLIEAAENSGSAEFLDTQELEGEEQKSKAPMRAQQ